MKLIQKLRKNRKGFSLVELIVVIAIMAVLVGVIAPNLIRNIEKSRESRDISQLDDFISAVQAAAANETINDEISAYKGTTAITIAIADILKTTNDNTLDALGKELLNDYKTTAFDKAECKCSNGTLVAYLTIDNGTFTAFWSEDEGASAFDDTRSGNTLSVSR